MPKLTKKTYIKDESFDPIYKPINSKFFFKVSALPFSILALGGILLVSQVVVPLVSFKTQNTVSKPISNSALGQVTGFREFEFEELDTSREYGTTAVLGTQDTKELPQQDFFTISIPRLNIENALVEINAPTLKPDEALGHYTGSALPGETGNSFVYGHSVLPFFYNPKNYKTIFSRLSELNQEDMVHITFRGKRLTYKVEGKRELKPMDVDPLAETKPKFLNESTMVLMTCSPAGTKLKRLLVDMTLVVK